MALDHMDDLLGPSHKDAGLVVAEALIRTSDPAALRSPKVHGYDPFPKGWTGDPERIELLFEAWERDGEAIRRRWLEILQ